MRPTDTTDIKTNDLDLAAAYMVVTGRQPSIHREPGDQLVSIDLRNDEVTINLLVAYAAGDLVLNVRRFAACRNWLYRQAKEAR